MFRVGVDRGRTIRHQGISAERCFNPMDVELVRAPLGSASAGWEVVQGVLVVVADPALSTRQVDDVVWLARRAVEVGQRQGAS
jgi:hypothetical protein